MTGSTLITNAQIIDGSGRSAKKGDVLLGNGVIKEVKFAPERISSSVAGERIDAKNMTLAPGFIDAHGHSDISLLAAPEAIGKISQGITSEIAGNCGLSPFPVTGKNREHLEELWRNYNVALTWKDYHGYRLELLRRNPAINLFSLCGHNTLRSAVVGYEQRELTPMQEQQMKLLLLEAYQQGASGFSSGLLYTPGIFSTEDELTALMKVAAPFCRVYTTHLRSEGDYLLEAVKESIRLCKNANQRYLHLSHLKTALPRNHHKIDALLELIEAANAENKVKISADRYPYIESLTQLSIALPGKYHEMDDIALMNLLQNPEQFKIISADLANSDQTRLNQVRLVSAANSSYHRFAGLKLQEISTITLKSAAEITVDILRQDAPGAMAAFCGMSTANMRAILKKNFVACGTDESARPQDMSLGVSHPRGFGSMARFIGILRSENFTLEEAVARVTSLPAEIFGLWNRGRISPDMAADLVLLNPERFHPSATFASPHELTGGIECVWVNGKIKYQSQNRSYNYGTTV